MPIEPLKQLTFQMITTDNLFAAIKRTQIEADRQRRFDGKRKQRILALRRAFPYEPPPEPE